MPTPTVIRIAHEGESTHVVIDVMGTHYYQKYTVYSENRTVIQDESAGSSEWCILQFEKAISNA